ncbi:MAG: helix-turn-helix domain-containing protein [Thermosphaera sp.]
MRIERPEQARALSNPQSRKYFKPFVARERSVSEASKDVGCSVETMAYRVRTFMKADLLEVTRIQRRVGRPIKYYRAVADVFFIPFTVMPYTTVQEALEMQATTRMTSLLGSVARILDEIGRTGQYLFRGPDGDVWLSGTPPWGQPSSAKEALPALDSVGELQLTREQAKAFLEELLPLLDRYESFQTEGREKDHRPFGYCFIFAPVRE